MKKAKLCLHYGEVSIGPVVALHVQDVGDSTHSVFYETTLPYLITMYIEQAVIWWLHLRGNVNLAVSGLYEQMHEKDKLSGLWFPYSTFSAAGEAVAIESKLRIIEIATMEPNELYSRSISFLASLPNSPTPRQYVPSNESGKRGRYDPGPVFGYGNQIFDLYPQETTKHARKQES